MSIIPSLYSHNLYLTYSKALVTKINNTIDKLLNIPQPQPKYHLQPIIQQLITSNDIQDWIVIKSILNSPYLSNTNKLIQLIQQNIFNHQQTYIMRVYLYGLMRQKMIRFTRGKTQRQLKLFAHQGKLSIFNSWIAQTPPSKQTQQTLYMLIKYYPQLVHQQYLSIQPQQLQFILHIITHIQITNSTQQQSQPNKSQSYQKQSQTYQKHQLSYQKHQYQPQKQKQNDISNREQVFCQIDKLLQLIKTFRIPLTSRQISNRSNYLLQYNMNRAIDNINQDNERIDREQFVIIKLTLQILALSKYSTSNAVWMFTQDIIRQQDARLFIALHGDTVLNYNQTQLINIFSKLFHATLQPNVLALFKQLAYAMRQAQKYYQLKQFYKHIVLPILVYRGKARSNLQHQILQVASFFIVGFFHHCDIGINGIKCILSNLNKLQHLKQIKHKWIQLALLISDKNKDQYLQIVYQTLSIQNTPQEQINEIDKYKGFDHFEEYQIWQITKRNSRKLKTYNKSVSKLYKGIQNNSIQCYIISVMQALFTTGELAKVLREFYTAKYNMLSYHVNELFKNLQPHQYQRSSQSFISQPQSYISQPQSFLSHIQPYQQSPTRMNGSHIRITVDNVKKHSPQQFAQEKQQDAQQYLSKLLQTIQTQLITNKEQLLLKEFYNIFRFSIKRKLQCQHCQYVIDKSQELFIHTVTNKLSLRQNYVEQIEGYKCQKCSKSKFLNKTTFQPTSKILIIHINRFSFVNGKSRKELATQPIQRSFMNYKLVGMIFHIGKIVECGHYVYYFNQGGKKWIQMNDQQVNEFQLDNQNQQFERQMRAQMTPYLLFYVKK